MPRSTHPPPSPHEEAERLLVLQSYGVLDTPPEERFDRITRLAADLAGTPMAMVSLVDADRQFFKSRIGTDTVETPRDPSFCTLAIENEGPLVVEDAAEDPRFAGSPIVVNDPFARFYAGIPLRAPSGHPLGVLCVVDTAPRTISERTLAQLETLAAVVVDELERTRRDREEVRQRTRHADELAEREAAFRALAEHPPDLVARYDRDLRVLYVNPTAERVSGMPRAEQIGKTAGGVGAASERLPGWADHIRSVFETGQTIRNPFSYPCADGETRRFEAVFAPEHDASAAVTTVLMNARDVTAHVASERRYRALVDAMSSIVWRMGADGHSDLELVGGELIAGDIPEVAAVNLFNFIHPDDRERARTMWAEAVRTGEALETEYRLKLPEGRTGWFTARAVPVRDETGEVLEWIGANTEVTDRKEAEAAVQRSERRFRSLVQNSSEIISLMRRDGSILYQSASIERITGHPPDALVNRSGFAYIHEDDLPEVLGVFGGATEGAGSNRVQYRFHRADGTWIWLESVATNMLDDPDVGAVVVNTRDISEQKARETELIEAREKAEEMARLKDAFLANMSHEIRTPLTSILGFADLLHDVVDEDGRELVEYIQTGGRRLRDTLTSVLELSQLQAGRIEIRTAPIALAPLIDETLQVLAPQALKNHVTLTSSVIPADLRVVAERSALCRTLTNLVGNAIKFTPAGGSVHVQATALHRHDTEDEPRVAITVSDTGVGISAAFLPYLFDDFRQESHGMSRSHEGSGLGLAITNRLVSLMGGRIAVESTKGTGTTFTVEMQGVLAAEEPAGSEELTRRGREREPRVLLVEDDESTRLYVRYALKGFDLEVAADADEALALAASATADRPYDVALIDINLGGSFGGVELVPRLRQMRSCEETRFVAMTAYALPGDKRRFLGAGFDGYLAKPFTRDALWGVLKGAG